MMELYILLDFIVRTKKQYKGREAAFYSGTNCKNIPLSNRKIRLELINNYVKEFLRYIRCEFAI